MAETRGQGYLNTFAAYNAGKLDEAIQYAQAEAGATLEKQKAYRQYLTDRVEELDARIMDYEGLIDTARQAEIQGRGEIRDDLVNAWVKVAQLSLHGQELSQKDRQFEAEYEIAKLELVQDTLELGAAESKMVGQAGSDALSYSAMQKSPEQQASSIIAGRQNDASIAAKVEGMSGGKRTLMAIQSGQNIIREQNAYNARNGIPPLPADEVKRIMTNERMLHSAMASTKENPMNTEGDVEKYMEEEVVSLLEEYKATGAGVNASEMGKFLMERMKEEFGVDEKAGEEDVEKKLIQTYFANDGLISNEEAIDYYNKYEREQRLETVMAPLDAELKAGSITSEEYNIKLAEYKIALNTPENVEAYASELEKTSERRFGGDPIFLRYMEMGKAKSERGTTEQELSRAIRDTEVPRYEDIMQRAGEIHQQQYISPREVNVRPSARKQAAKVGQMTPEETSMYRAHVDSRKMLKSYAGGVLDFETDDDGHLFDYASTYADSLKSRENTLQSIEREAEQAAEAILGRDVTPESREAAKNKYKTYVMFQLNKAEVPDPTE